MIQVAIFVFCGWIVSICLHEFGHALVAYWGGDTSVKDKGYLTFNPLKYTNLSLSLILPMVFLLLGGIPLPGAAVYINQQQLRNRWWKSAVSAAGPAASFLAAILLATPFWLGLISPNFMVESLHGFLMKSNGDWLLPALAFLIVLDIYTALLNLLPLPPLDGYGIIEPWLPQKVQTQLRSVGIVGIIGLFLLVLWVPEFGRALFSMAFMITEWLRVPPEFAALGAILFNERPIVFFFATILSLLLLRSLLKSVKSFQDIWVNGLDIIGFFLLIIKQFKLALLCYDKAIEIQPNAYEVIWMNRGSTLGNLQRYEEAIACYDKAIEINPNFRDSDLNQGIHQTWLGRGTCYFNLQQYEAAIDSYNKALEIKPDLDNAWLLCGIAWSRLKNYSEALNCYERVLQLKPNSHTAWSLKGNILKNLKRYDESLTAYEKAIKMQPNDAATWHDRGILMAELQRYEEALFSYRQALKINPDFPLTIHAMGWLLIKIEQYEDALNFCQKYLQKSPKSYQIINIQGAALSRLNRNEEAVAAYDRAIAIKPDYPESWYNKACHYAENGDVNLAVVNLQQAIRINPQNFTAKMIQSDTSFDRIREAEEFQQLINEG